MLTKVERFMQSGDGGRFERLRFSFRIHLVQTPAPASIAPETWRAEDKMEKSIFSVARTTRSKCADIAWNLESSRQRLINQLAGVQETVAAVRPGPDGHQRRVAYLVAVNGSLPASALRAQLSKCFRKAF